MYIHIYIYVNLFGGAGAAGDRAGAALPDRPPPPAAPCGHPAPYTLNPEP